MLNAMAIGSDRGYRYLDHTADIGIEAWGPDLRTVFTEAALGLFALMVDPATVSERRERRVSLDGDDPEDLFVGWLSELIALVDTERMVLRRAEIDVLDPSHLEARVWGEPIDPTRHHLRTAVKAATYHALEIEAGPPARAKVILDL